MAFKSLKRIKIIAALSTAIAASSLFVVMDGQLPNFMNVNAADSISSQLTMDDFPSDYKYAADWIWKNRIERENSTVRRNTIFDQIIAGNGTINYVVKWQSYKPITLKQRQDFEHLVSNSINAWTDWLAGYENWPYDHIDVNIVGWAVIDENCILDRQPDEIVYTDTIYYDSTYDTVPDPINNPVPDKEPIAPSEISRFDHFADSNYEYPGGLDKRFDMYLWGTQGFPSIGGCGGDWGQRLSDDAYINMLDGSGLHVLEHEIGHGFGMTDFYGGEGDADGFPPGGFPGGENSLMMAGSAMKITDFDGWMLRYMWTKISKEEGRFDIPDKPINKTKTAEFTDTITSVTDFSIKFAEHGMFTFGEEYYGDDESKNLIHYEIGDRIFISFTYDLESKAILNISFIDLIEDNHIHKGGTDTCTSGAVCEECGKEYGSAKGHSFSNYISNGDGTKTAKCDNCNETDTITDVITTEPEPDIIGDLNGDRIVTISDAVIMKQHLCKLRSFSNENITKIDLNNDKLFNVLDWIILKRIIINN